MKKIALIYGLFAAALNMKSQSIYTDVYNAYQTLNGREDKTIDTSKRDEKEANESNNRDSESDKRIEAIKFDDEKPKAKEDDPDHSSL